MLLNRILLFICYSFIGQYVYSQINISGKVSNGSGEAIDYASIFLVNTSYASVSDENGRYLLSGVPPGEYTLKCTFLGYKSIEKNISIGSVDTELDILMPGEIYALEDIEIINSRVEAEDAFTFTNMNKEDIAEWNTGQDMPYLLRFTPSVVVTSDAGTGIGYTGIRIRGVDASRVNVSINGIPLNDSESQSVFWVNMPDLGSSVENIQIQRGVGASSAGVGAFGGSISVNTQKTYLNPYLGINLGYGSFNTSRISAKVGSGLVQGKYSVDLRYSSIKSDGYIDRAISDLSSIYFAASRVSENNSTRLIVMSGSEVTYQSWYGAPEAKVSNDQASLASHYNNNRGSLYFAPADSVNLFSSDRKYNYYQYENQVDDYSQTHVQLLDNRKLSEKLVLNTALNFTHGAGFFEEYKFGQDLSDYNIEGGGSSDLIRRRWLNNNFYGGNFSLNYDYNEKIAFSSGISAFQYDGDHFGRVVDVVDNTDFERGNDYYYNKGKKGDLSAFAKGNFQLTGRLSGLLDLQVRKINYTIDGDDNDRLNIKVEDDFTFFNPKIGLSYSVNSNSLIYSSFAVANKEPGRSDFIDRPTNEKALAERLYDFEIGYRSSSKNILAELTFYNMAYKDQLVLSGALNDVGSALRTNIPSSYRRGIEASISGLIQEKWVLGFQATLSQNKIEKFTEILYDYTNGFEVIENNYENSDLSFSPNSIITANLGYNLNKELSFTMMNQYVSAQFLDNTSNDNRKLKAYLAGTLKMDYAPKLSFARGIRMTGEVRNLWNSLYASNGYTYSYVIGDLITENFLYPQAERSFMLSVAVDFGK